MNADDELIFVINLGSTSTKIALFEGKRQLVRSELHVNPEELSGLFEAVDQLPLRTRSIKNELGGLGINPGDFDIIVTRGGNLPHICGGAYLADKYMIDFLRYAPFQQHVSNIACMIGTEIAAPYGTPVMIYDSVLVDEYDDEARISGLPEIEIVPGAHVLNSRMVCRRTAETLGREYEDCNFIVAHMGGGCSVTIHKKGRIVDAVNSDMGPMAPDRAGRIQTKHLVRLCYEGGLTQRQMMKKLAGGAGILAHLGTQDMLEVEEMIQSGDMHAKLVWYAMACQTAKAIGECATVLSGNIDRIILTGGLAHSKRHVNWISERVSFLAPIEVIHGELEMEALAFGAYRVLSGEEQLKRYTLPPDGFDSIESFYKSLQKLPNQDAPREHIAPAGKKLSAEKGNELL